MGKQWFRWWLDAKHANGDHVRVCVRVCWGGGGHPVLNSYMHTVHSSQSKRRMISIWFPYRLYDTNNNNSYMLIDTDYSNEKHPALIHNIVQNSMVKCYISSIISYQSSHNLDSNIIYMFTAVQGWRILAIWGVRYRLFCAWCILIRSTKY